jgi:hypothetical protein
VEHLACGVIKCAYARYSLMSPRQFAILISLFSASILAVSMTRSENQGAASRSEPQPVKAAMATFDASSCTHSLRRRSELSCRPHIKSGESSGRSGKPVASHGQAQRIGLKSSSSEQVFCCDV